ncbi:hypothetical protein KCV03_g168, partial [Aureobasidium melanogenum]
MKKNEETPTRLLFRSAMKKTQCIPHPREIEKSPKYNDKKPGSDPRVRKEQHLKHLWLHPLRSADTKIQAIARPPSSDLHTFSAFDTIFERLLNIAGLVLDPKTTLLPPFENTHMSHFAGLFECSFSEYQDFDTTEDGGGFVRKEGAIKSGPEKILVLDTKAGQPAWYRVVGDELLKVR